MNKKESISEMNKHCRNVITVSKAIEIAEPWGLGVDDLPIDDFRVGIDWELRVDINKTGTGVPVYRLASLLVRHLGKIPAWSDKLGRGSMAEDITLKNCKLLEDSL